MGNSNIFFNKGYKKLIALMLSFSIGFDAGLFSQVAISSPAPISPQKTESPTTSFPLRNLIFPGMQSGKSFKGTGDGQLILIQDLHCHEEAQTKIAQAIETLSSKYGVNQVLMEGADGLVRTQLYSSFPDEKIRKQVASEFLKQGYLSGAEYAAIKMGKNTNLNLYGVEEASLYVENFKAFRKTRKLYQSKLESIKKFDQWLNELKKERYSKELMTLDAVSGNIQNGKIDTEELIKILKQDESNRELKDLEVWLETIKASKALDAEKVQISLNLLISHFQKSLAQEEMKEVIQWTLEYRLGKIEASEYLSRLRQKTGEVAFDREYSILETWRKISQAQKTFNTGELIKSVQVKLQEQMLRLSQKEHIEPLLNLDQYWSRLKHLIKLELSRSELEELKKKGSSTIPEDGFADTLGDDKSTNFLPFSKSIDPRLEPSGTNPLFERSNKFKLDIQDLIKSAWQFYELAQKRDHVLVQNALKAVNSGLGTVDSHLKKEINTGSRQSSNHKPRTTVLITGGFHTEAVQKQLEEANISYVTWTPIVSGDLNQSSYEKIMMDKSFDLDGIEFSEKRLISRDEKDPIRQMIATPDLFAEFEGLGELGQAALQQKIAGRLVELRIGQGASVPETFEEWFGGKFWEDLTEKEQKIVRRVFDLFYKVFQIEKYNPKSETQAYLAIGILERVFGNDSVVVQMTKDHFNRQKSKTLSEWRALYGKDWESIFSELDKIGFFFDYKEKRELREAIEKLNLKEGQKYLHVGCALYKLSFLLGLKGVQCVFVDLDPDGIGSAKIWFEASRKGLNISDSLPVRFITKNIDSVMGRNALTIDEENTFDAISMFHVFFDFNGNMSRAITNLLRLVKSQGILWFTPHTTLPGIMDDINMVTAVERVAEGITGTKISLEEIPNLRIDGSFNDRSINYAYRVIKETSSLPSVGTLQNMGPADTARKVLKLDELNSLISMTRTTIEANSREYPIKTETIGDGENKQTFLYQVVEFDENPNAQDLISVFAREHGFRNAFHLPEIPTGVPGKKINYIYVSKQAIDKDFYIQHELREIFIRKRFGDRIRTDIEQNNLPNGFTFERVIHILAWAMQVKESNWSRAEQSTFVSRHIETLVDKNDLASLVWIMKEARLMHRNLIASYLEAEWPECAEKIYSWEESIQDIVAQKIIDLSFPGSENEEIHKELSKNITLFIIVISIVCKNLALNAIDEVQLKRLLEVGGIITKRPFRPEGVFFDLSWNNARIDWLESLIHFFKDQGINFSKMDFQTKNSFLDILSELSKQRKGHYKRFVSGVTAMENCLGVRLRTLHPKNQEKLLTAICSVSQTEARGAVFNEAMDAIFAALDIHSSKDLSALTGDEKIQLLVAAYNITQGETKRLKNFKKQLSGINHSKSLVDRFHIITGLSESRRKKTDAGVGTLRAIGPYKKPKTLSQREMDELVDLSGGRSRLNSSEINGQVIESKVVIYNEDDENDLIGQTAKSKGFEYAFHIPASLSKDGKNYVFISSKAEEQGSFYQRHEVMEIYIRDKFGERIRQDIKQKKYPPEFTFERIIHILAWAMQMEENNWTEPAQVPFFEKEFNEKSLMDLFEIIRESRILHYRLIQSYLGFEMEEKIRTFDQSVKNFARNRVREIVLTNKEQNVLLRLAVASGAWGLGLWRKFRWGGSSRENKYFDIAIETTRKYGTAESEYLKEIYPHLFDSGYAIVNQIYSENGNERGIRRVYEAVNLSTGEIVIIKTGPRAAQEVSELKGQLDKSEDLGKTVPHLVRVMQTGEILKRGKVIDEFQIQNYAPYQNSEDWFRASFQGAAETDRVKLLFRFLYQIALELQALHQAGVTHGGVYNSSNILIDDLGAPWFVDLEAPLSKVISEKVNSNNDLVSIGPLIYGFIYSNKFVEDAITYKHWISIQFFSLEHRKDEIVSDIKNIFGSEHAEEIYQLLLKYRNTVKTDHSKQADSQGFTDDANHIQFLRKMLEQLDPEALREMDHGYSHEGSDVPDTSSEVDLGPSNIGLLPSGHIAGHGGIRGETVNRQVRVKRDDEIITFNVIDAKGKTGDELQCQLGQFMATKTYSDLDEETRTAFESTRLVILKDQVEVAYDKNGMSFGHYGEDRGPTQFIGEELLKELIKHPPLLARWIKIEMSRKIYREKKRKELLLRGITNPTKDQVKDPRSSLKAIRDLGFTPADVEALISIIIKTKVQFELQKMRAGMSDLDISQMVIYAAEQADKMGGATLEIADIDLELLTGIDLGWLKGRYLAEMKNQLAEILRASNPLSKEIHENYEDLSLAAAEKIRDQIKQKPNSVFLFPTGNTPKGMYRHLVRMAKAGEIDFTDVTIFMLDEYEGSTEYHDFIHEHLIHKLPSGKRPIIHVLNGQTDDVDRETKAYEDKIQAAGGVDLAVLGLGVEGHIAFNEKGSSPFKRTRRVKLAQSTIETNPEAKAKGYTHALTTGIATILEARKILVLANGSKKAKIVKEFLANMPTKEIPATYLKFHPGVTVMLDKEAAGQIGDNSNRKKSFDAVWKILERYSNVHRGTGQHSQVSTHLFEQARFWIGERLGMDRENQELILATHPQDALEALAHDLRLSAEDEVISDARKPWGFLKRLNLPIKGGKIDFKNLEKILQRGKIKVLSIQNPVQLGLNPSNISSLSKLTLQYGVKLIVDASEWSYKEVNAKSLGINYLIFEGGKVSPFAPTVVLADRRLLKTGTDEPPRLRGGGTKKFIRKGKVVWADAPDKFEVGSPNIVGTILLGSFLKNDGNLPFGNDATKPQSQERPFTIDLLRKTLIGKDLRVPTRTGEQVYVNFDNGASTPTFIPILEAVEKYISVTPAEQKAMVVEAIETVFDYFGVSSENCEHYSFRNTSEAANYVAHEFANSEDDVVVNSFIEHNSNELPWRTKNQIRLEADENGFIDLKQLEDLLIEYNLDQKQGSKRIKLLAISGASNVLGTVNDFEKIGALTKKYGVKFMLDGAQLSAHREVDMEKWNIDFLVYSGHKIYAPFGHGGLIARKGLLKRRRKSIPSPEGLVAVAKAFEILKKDIGLQEVAHHEEELLRYALEKFQELGQQDGVGLKIYGISDPQSNDLKNKTGVLAFNLQIDEKHLPAQLKGKKFLPYNLVAAVLAEEGGVGGRAGCFCADLLIQKLWGITDDQAIALEKQERTSQPGAVRISFGIYNTKEDIDRVFEVLERLVRGEIDLSKYEFNEASGEYYTSEHLDRMEAFLKQAEKAIFGSITEQRSHSQLPVVRPTEVIPLRVHEGAFAAAA